MALIDEYTAAKDPTFINKCQMAAITYAIDVVQGEPTNTDNHANRSIYAKAVVGNPSFFAPFLAQGVAALLNLTDPTTVTDVNINNSVATIWNMYAGTV